MLIMGRIREKNGHPLGACFFCAGSRMQKKIERKYMGNG